MARVQGPVGSHFRRPCASMPERASDFVKTTVYLLVNAMPFARDEARALSLRLLLFSNHL